VRELEVENFALIDHARAGDLLRQREKVVHVCSVIEDFFEENQDV